MHRYGVREVEKLLRLPRSTIRAFVDAVVKAKPAASKGTYVKKLSISSSMGPGLKLDLASITASA